MGSGALAPDWIPQPALSASFTRGVEPVTLVVAFGEADALAHVRTASTLSAVAECAAAALTEMESDKARVGSLLVQAAADICYVSGGAAGALDLTSAQFVRDLLRDTQGRTARVRPRNGVDLEVSDGACG